MKDIALFIFNNDLRIKHNQAFIEAVANHDQVHTAYNFYLPKLKKYGPKRNAFLFDCLSELNNDLADVGYHLEVFSSKTASAALKNISDFIAQKKINAIYFNESVDLEDQKLLSALEKRAKLRDCDLNPYFDQGILRPQQLLKSDGSPYLVFTPFYKNAQRVLYENPTVLRNASFKRKKTAVKPKSISAPSWLAMEDYDKTAFPAGENEALKKLTKFLEQDVAQYHEARDYFAENKTSNLSPYLTVGAVSIKTCASELNKKCFASMKKADSGAAVFLKELFWRDFYRYLWLYFPRLSQGEPFISASQKIPWSKSIKDFNRWTNGETGFPIVDAAMRYLNESGRMHNRLRMVVASFLTKNLLIDWHKGEEYFLKKLIDADLPSNNGGWQWSASTGCDAQPYFRIFNPVRQSERFDGEAVFIRKIIKPLAHLNSKQIHDPSGYFEASALKAISYVPAICDLGSSAKKAQAVYKRALAKSA